MITKRELLQTIEDIENASSTFSDCQKLAILYTVRDHLFPEIPKEARVEVLAESYVEMEGKTDFAQAVNGKNAKKAWEVMDELMNAMEALHPRIYNAVLQKMYEI